MECVDESTCTGPDTTQQCGDASVGGDRRGRVVVVAPRTRSQGAAGAREPCCGVDEIDYAVRTFLAATTPRATAIVAHHRATALALPEGA